MNRHQESWTRDTYFRAATNLCANILKEIRRQEDAFCSKNAVFEQKLDVDRQHFLSRLDRQSYGNINGTNRNSTKVNDVVLRCAVEKSLYQEDEEKYRVEYISDLQRELPLAFLSDELELELKCNLQRLLREKLCAVALLREKEANLADNHQPEAGHVSNTHKMANCKTSQAFTKNETGERVLTPNFGPQCIQGAPSSSALITGHIRSESEIVVDLLPTAALDSVRPTVLEMAAEDKVKVAQNSTLAALGGGTMSNKNNRGAHLTECRRRSQGRPLGRGAVWIPCPAGAETPVYWSTPTAEKLSWSGTQVDGLDDTIHPKGMKSRRLEGSNNQRDKFAPSEVAPPLRRTSCEMEAFGLSSSSTNQKIAEPIAMPAMIPSEISSTMRQSLHAGNADRDEGVYNLPIWVTEMMAAAPRARVSLLALRFIQKAFQSEVLHKCHFFACRRAILRDKLTEMLIACNPQEGGAESDGNKNKHRAAMFSSLMNKHVLSSDATHTCDLVVENAQGETRTKAKLHDLQHRLRELTREESTCNEITSKRLEFTNRLLNAGRHTRSACHTSGGAAKRDTMDMTRCQGITTTSIEGGILSDSSTQIQHIDKELSKYLQDVSPKESGMNTEGCHSTSSLCDDVATVLNSEESSRCTKESVSPLKRDMLQKHSGGEYVIIQLESEELNRDEPVLSYLHNNPTFALCNDLDERGRKLRWFRREVQRYLWPADLEQRIGHSLHGYVRPSNRSWRPIIVRKGATNFQCQQKADTGIVPEAFTTHTKSKTFFGAALRNESMGCEADVGSGYAGVPRQFSQTHREELDGPLSNLSYVVPKLPWKGTRVILLVRGAGDLMSSEVTFSTFGDGET